MRPTPRSFSHIGLSVPDIDAAVSFYTEVLGFYTIMQPTEIVEDDSDIGQMCTDVFGPGWRSLRIAHLATADRIGFELFEFDGNEAPDDNLPFRRHGMSILRNGYADGGLVSMPRTVPYIPPMPATAGAGELGGGSILNLSLDGQTYQLSGPSTTIEDLARAVRLRKLKGS